MWESKGYVRALGLFMLIAGNYLSGHGLDLSTLPDILMTLGAPVGILGILNALMKKK